MEDGLEGDEDAGYIEWHGTVQESGRRREREGQRGGIATQLLFSASAHGNVDLLCAVFRLSSCMVSSVSLQNK